MLHAVRIEAEVTLTRVYTAYVDDHDQPLEKTAIETEARRIAEESPDKLVEQLETDVMLTCITSVEYDCLVRFA